MNRTVLIGLAIFVFALGLRLIGVGWSLKNDIHNESYHPDELVNFDISQRLNISAGNFIPQYYNYGTLYFTILDAVSEGVVVFVGKPGPTPPEHREWAAKCELWGRIVTAAFGAGTAVLVFALMRRFTTLLGAVLSGAVMAIAPAHVVHSRFITVDVTCVFFIVASAYAALKILPAETDDPQELDEALDMKLGLKYAALAGLFAGLSAGVKYTGILALLTLYAVLLIAKRKKWLMEAGVGTLTAIVAFVASTPGCLLDRDQFVRDVRFEMNHVATGHGLAFLDTPSGFVYHISNLFLGLGTLLTVACVGGLVWAAVRKEKWCLALLAFAIPYYVLIGREEVKFLRYTFPLYLALAAAFGWLVVELHRRGGWGRIGVGFCICAIGGLDFGGLRSAVTQTAWMAGEDPRDSAMRYIRSVQTPATRLGLCREIWYWSVPAIADNDVPATPDKRIRAMGLAFSPPLDLVTNPDRSEAIAFSPDLVTKLHPEYIAFTSIEDANLERLHDSADITAGDKSFVDRFAVFGDALKKNYKLDRVFGTGGLPVEDMEYINPVVYVWKRIATS